MRFTPTLPICCLILLAACSATPPAPQEAPQASIPVIRAKLPSRPFPEDTFLDLLVAEFAMRRNDFETALDNYAYQAEQTDDIGVVSTATRLAQYLNRDEETLKLARHWVALEPDNAEALFALASVLSKLGDPLAAFPYMQQVLAQGAEANFAALAASTLTQSEAQQQRFLDQLKALRKQYPSEPSLKVAMALLLQYRDEEEKALKLAREVLAEEPDNAHALLIETRTLSQLGRHEEARDRLRYAVDQNPRHKRLRHDLARNLVSDKLYEAKAQYQVLVNQNPGDEDLLLELMLINRELDFNAEADQQLETLENRPGTSSRVNYILGRIAEDERDWQQAIAHYRKVEGDPEFKFASQRIAAISLATQSPEAALEQMAALREEHPEQRPDLYLLSAEILRKSGQFQQGFELLSRAIEEFPDNKDLRYSRSLFAEALGNIDLVELDLRKLIADDPNDAAALNALGYTLANRTNRLDEARKLVKRALELQPDDPAIIDSYGWILFLQGNADDAVVLLERAFSMSQDHEIAAHLGEALWQTGERARAKEVFKRGLEDTPGSGIILDTLQRLQLLND